MMELPIVPGRGLNTYSAIQSRLNYLRKAGLEIDDIARHALDPADIQKNIESFIGSVEMPVGIVGPLLYHPKDRKPELVFTVAGTLEGALIASMNRGAKAISKSGGFQAVVRHQKMVRAPLFLFAEMNEALAFEKWVIDNFEEIKAQAQLHSNHAALQELDIIVMGKAAHVKFVYKTGDAAGQNMTTTCTWHAMLWMAEHFQEESGFAILDYVIEGNGSSDKKVSHYSMAKGRGTHVVAECVLKESVINRVLRTNSQAILDCFYPSVALSKVDGMIGYNINVANAIAAIFLATGQDLASVHESSIAILQVEKVEEGLWFSLTLPALVIGTVGGGTHLPKQTEALQLMGCRGSGKVERFAQLIAGFALSLEISTYAAIVSGEFAKAHEKLGRNKPVDWLTRSEIDALFVQKCLSPKWREQSVKNIRFLGEQRVDNGVITTLTSRVSKKLMGFIPLEVEWEDERSALPIAIGRQPILLKSKALDIEVIKGLHLMAASIDPKLSDLLNRFRHQLEYAHCHLKEILLYESLDQAGFDCTPQYYGKRLDEKRQAYLLMSEMLDEEALAHINSQKAPELWTETQIKRVIKEIAGVHQYFVIPENRKKLDCIHDFEPWQAEPLYEKLVSIMYTEEDRPFVKARLGRLFSYLKGLEEERKVLDIPNTIVHNDCNSRNIAIRKDGRACIYDWELAVLDVPQRDIVEFLSFVLVEDFSEERLFDYLEYHFELQAEGTNRDQWFAGYRYALKVYLLSRVSFYEVAGILDRYAFSDRILSNAFRMLELLER
ncbi:MAG: phosphotransferase [Bacteroidota bacterium]